MSSGLWDSLVGGTELIQIVPLFEELRERAISIWQDEHYLYATRSSEWSETQAQSMEALNEVSSLVTCCVTCSVVPSLIPMQALPPPGNDQG